MVSQRIRKGNLSMKHHYLSITVLIDNHADQGLTAEHGLALYIEVEKQRILFDTGQGKALLKNARTLGVDLGSIHQLVLSHGHYDHTGGFSAFLQHATNVDVYCHPGVTQPRYVIRNGQPKSIHMPPETRMALDRVSEQHLHWVSEPARITDAIGLTGPIPRKTSYEDTGGSFYLDPQGRRSDTIIDDLAMWIATDRGLVVCVGCCHAGLVNTLNYIQQVSGISSIRAVIGGFHLLNANPQRIAQTAAALQSLAPVELIPCHCTGESAVTALQRALGERVSPGKAGAVYRF
jgi:7,8-dihydropterin-6-yl-methyl-4-(beta-D-ribofuranosyl)aminobenzene 5'-phosphate synthase